jgi:uncharacterized protein YndB with AHSA1/START domain
MPEFTLTGRADAPVEEVWKLVFDPGRFPEWLVGTVRPDGPEAFTWWLGGEPDPPLPQRMRADEAAARVTVSCQVHDVGYAWRLTADGEGTTIQVRAELAESEAHRVDGLRSILTTSMRSLTALAESEARDG